MDNKLIANLFPTVHLFGDERNYVLIIRKDVRQSMRNGYHLYFTSLSSVFAELFEHQVRTNLADNRNKTVEEMIENINNTRKQILDLLAPFEQLKPKVQGQQEPAQLGIRGVDTPKVGNVPHEDKADDKCTTLRGPIPREDMPF
ncbi:MAG: hypothetical protein NTU76_03745 [Candidatus Taylorbacteria bacterium]|nr:hypothetical protein [Candidatus Taylorbacteria bacterium]